jgi:hypothetical protein
MLLVNFQDRTANSNRHLVRGGIPHRAPPFFVNLGGGDVLVVEEILGRFDGTLESSLQPILISNEPRPSNTITDAAYITIPTIGTITTVNADDYARAEFPTLKWIGKYGGQFHRSLVIGDTLDEISVTLHGTVDRDQHRAAKNILSFSNCQAGTNGASTDKRHQFRSTFLEVGNDPFPAQ